MTTYRASVHVDEGMLHTSRPMTAPDQVSELVDSVLYDVRNGDGTLASVELVVETTGTSDTPLGDSIAGTSSTPLPGSDVPTVEDDEPLPATSATTAMPATPPAPGGRS